jgi:hypothetical protein
VDSFCGGGFVCWSLDLLEGQRMGIWTTHSLALCLFAGPFGLLSHTLTRWISQRFFPRSDSEATGRSRSGHVVNRHVVSVGKYEGWLAETKNPVINRQIKKRGLIRLIKLITTYQIEHLVLTHKDRLIPFALQTHLHKQRD